MTQEISIPEVSKRYAKAIFELASEDKKLDKISKDLMSLDKAINENDRLSRLITSPTFSSNEQIQVMGSLLDKQEAAKIVKRKLITWLKKLMKLYDQLMYYQKFTK